MLILIAASPEVAYILTAIDVAALAVTTTTSGRLGTRSRAECRATVVAIVESTLSAVTVTSTCHFYMVTVCTNGVDRE